MTTELEPRHWRAIIGCALMLVGIFGYAAIVFHVGGAPDACAPTWMQLLRQYGFPGALLVGGYNLFQPGALAEIVSSWRGAKPT